MRGLDSCGCIELLKGEMFEEEAFGVKLVFVDREVLVEHVVLVGHGVRAHCRGWVEVNALRDPEELLLLNLFVSA